MEDTPEIPDALPEGFKAVVSSNIKGVMLTEEAQHPETGTLEIIFKNNAHWKYKHVPKYLFEEMLEAESIGKFYNTHIKSNQNFESEKVITETEAPK